MATQFLKIGVLHFLTPNLLLMIGQSFSFSAYENALSYRAMINNKLQNFLEYGLIKLHKETYCKVLIILAPLLNFLSGLNTDLYTPSMPAIAHYYSASFAAVKNTVTATLLGFAIGCVIFGILLDVLGRRRTILLGLFLYMLASFAALICQDIMQLILVRFLQGITIATVSVGCRAVIIDSFTGHRFTVALLYTSLAYGLGPIIAPFFGGILQYYIGWKANFVTYGLASIILMLIFALFVNESIPKRHTFSVKKITQNYVMVLKHPIFLTGTFISGLSQIIIIMYSTVGSFLVETILHHTPITYGNTALLIGCGYLTGTLTSRFLTKKFHLHHLISAGYGLLILGLVLQIIFAIIGDLNLITLILPIFVMCYSQGLIFPNVMARILRLFLNHAGIAIAVLVSVCMIIASIGMFCISHIEINNLTRLAVIFFVVVLLQFFIFLKFFKPQDPLA